jgi:thioredoxin reductase
MTTAFAAIEQRGLPPAYAQHDLPERMPFREPLVRVRGPYKRIRCGARHLEPRLLDRIHAAHNVEVLTETEVAELEGESLLEAVGVRNRKTGERRRIETHWLFVCIGGSPRTEWAAEAGERAPPSSLPVTSGMDR